jgi:hypothetical protein
MLSRDLSFILETFLTTVRAEVWKLEKLRAEKPHPTLCSPGNGLREQDLCADI